MKHFSLCLSILLTLPIMACEKPVSFNDLLTNDIINNIQLPQVLSRTEVEPAIVLSIHNGNIYLGKTVVALKSDLTTPASYGGQGMVANLYTALLNARKQWTNLYSGTTKKIDELQLLGFNQLPAGLNKANINNYLKPPVLIASDGDLTITELTAIMSTSVAAGLNKFQILVINRGDGTLSQEEILAPGINDSNRPTLNKQADIDFHVRISPDKIDIIDIKNILLGPNGEPTMSTIRRPTGLFDTQEFENFIRTLKRQFPTTDRAGIGGQKDAKLSIITELLTNMRCHRNSDGSCESGYFANIGIWPADYNSFLLGPIVEEDN